ncbi:MAG TPA: COX15/CtaA family protein [Pelomicrobium sp.]|nr:COX15/CtaA family protein [Pelomicrobium sp.]
MSASPPLPSDPAAPAAAASPVSVASAPEEHRARRRVAAWLFTICLLVFAMIVLGGVTRLTHSGLSITEWEPFIGTVPPLSDADWQAQFEKYQLTPEFRLRNFDMTIEDFKPIFWMEYAHRLLGRVIGLAYLLPLLYFFATRQVPRGMGGWLVALFLLGGLQGAVGWFMVASGLVDDPRVSQYRLTLHLSLAFLILAAALWLALSLARPPYRGPVREDARLPKRVAYAVVGLVAMMVLTGGFVAGIRAGLAYNTFPLMNGHFVPPEIFMLEPWWSNLFNNMATVQFNHRLFAWLLIFTVPVLWWLVRRRVDNGAVRLASTLLLAWLGVQVGLGIAAVLLRIPVAVAASHQGGAAVFLALALWTAFELRRVSSVSSDGSRG